MAKAVNSSKTPTLKQQKQQPWFDSASDKAFLLNRYDGHTWSQFYLRCSFLDENSFCSSSEDGFLCVWDLNQTSPVQKQRVSNFVLNDVAVKRIQVEEEEQAEEEEGVLQEEKEPRQEANEAELSQVGNSRTTSRMKVVIAVGSDDCLVRVL